MATPSTVATWTLNGSATEFDVPFDYLSRTFVKVTLIGATHRQLVLGTDYQFITPTRIQTFVAFGQPMYTLIEVRRATSTTERLVEFNDASVLTADDMNIADLQVIHIAEEARDAATESIGPGINGNLDARYRRIINLGPSVDDTDAVSLGEAKTIAKDTAEAVLPSPGFGDRLSSSEGASMVGFQAGSGFTGNLSGVARAVQSLQTYGAGSSLTQTQLNNAIAGNAFHLIMGGTSGVDLRQGHGGKSVDAAESFKVINSATGHAHAQVVKGVTTYDSYTYADYSMFASFHPVVMAYGDSNTAFVDESGRVGIGQGSWRSYLEVLLSQHVYFASSRVLGQGSPGQTSQYALDNFDQFMSTYLPKITILGWGTNDMAKDVPLAQYIKNMALLIEKFKLAGVQVHVLGIPWHATLADKARSWNSSLMSLCNTYEVPFIPVFTLFASAPSFYFAGDGVHYTVQANKIIAEKLRDSILTNYKLPRDSMRVHRADNFSAKRNPLMRSSGCKAINIVQTPDAALRRMFPYCYEIPIGVEVSFSGNGPHGVLFDWPDSKDAVWELNGAAYNPVTIGGIVRIMSVDTRLDGSYGTFRVKSVSGSPLYVLATVSQQIPDNDVPIITPVSARLLDVVAGQEYIVSAGGSKSVRTVFDPVVASERPTGRPYGSAIANAGPRSVRTAITAAPEGWVFLETDNDLWFRFSGGSWVAM